jgi:hypothetical protein
LECRLSSHGKTLTESMDAGCQKRNFVFAHITSVTFLPMIISGKDKHYFSECDILQKFLKRLSFPWQGRSHSKRRCHMRGTAFWLWMDAYAYLILMLSTTCFTTSASGSR